MTEAAPVRETWMIRIIVAIVCNMEDEGGCGRHNKASGKAEFDPDATPKQASLMRYNRRGNPHYSRPQHPLWCRTTTARPRLLGLERSSLRGAWGKVVARDRYRLSPHVANIRYLLRLSA
jgi:hypothetical protein